MVPCRKEKNLLVFEKLLVCNERHYIRKTGESLAGSSQKPRVEVPKALLLGEGAPDSTKPHTCISQSHHFLKIKKKRENKTDALFIFMLDIN